MLVLVLVLDPDPGYPHEFERRSRGERLLPRDVRGAGEAGRGSSLHWIDCGDPAESTTPSRPPPSQTVADAGGGASCHCRSSSVGLEAPSFGCPPRIRGASTSTSTKDGERRLALLLRG